MDRRVNNKVFKQGGLCSFREEKTFGDHHHACYCDAVFVCFSTTIFQVFCYKTNKQTKKVDIGSTAALQCTKHCECMLCTPLPDTGHHYYTITILSCWDFSHGKLALM